MLLCRLQQFCPVNMLITNQVARYYSRSPPSAGMRKLYSVTAGEPEPIHPQG